MSDSFAGLVEVNGTRLFARVDGPEGATVVALANSLGTSHEMWDAQLAALTAKYRVLRYDARGHGQSDAPAGPYTMDLLVDDLAGLLQHFDAKRSVVAGVSLGGLTAIAAGLRRIDGLAGIAVCDSRADMPPEFVRGIDDRNKLVREQGMAPVGPVMIQRWFTAPTLAAKPAYLDRIERMITGMSVEGFTGSAEAIKTCGLRPRVKDLKLPTLFVVGDADAALPVELMREMHDEVPGSTFVVIPGAGHLSNVEQPELFNQALLWFIDGLLT